LQTPADAEFAADHPNTDFVHAGTVPSDQTIFGQ
jgi:hypothetical protein